MNVMKDVWRTSTGSPTCGTVTVLLHLSSRWTVMHVCSMWGAQIAENITLFYSVGLCQTYNTACSSLTLHDTTQRSVIPVVGAAEPRIRGLRRSVNALILQTGMFIRLFTGEKNSVRLWYFSLTFWIYSEFRMTTAKMNLCTWTVNWDRTHLLRQEEQPQHRSR